MKERITCALLALCLMLALLPANVWAEDVPTTPEVVVIDTIEQLAEALTPDETGKPTVEGNTVTLTSNVSVSKILEINCDAVIDLGEWGIALGDGYIQVDSGRTVEITVSALGGYPYPGSISSSGDAAVIAMRGSELTIGNVNITANNGYGVMVKSEPQDGEGGLQTKLSLSQTSINAIQGGVYVDSGIREQNEDQIPVLTLENVQITSSEGAGLHLAGMAETAIKSSLDLFPYGSCTISGAVGIGIKSGTLSIGSGVEIRGTGEYVEQPDAGGDGIHCDGSAILIENDPGCAGNVKIEIEGTESGNPTAMGRTTLHSDHSYAIREVSAEGWDGAAPEITMNGACVIEYSADLESAIKTDKASLFTSTDGWEILPVEELAMEMRASGGEPDYEEAYRKAGLTWSGPSHVDDGTACYTLSVDMNKLQNIDEETAAFLRYNGNEFYVSVEYKMPERIKDTAVKALANVSQGSYGYGNFETVEPTNAGGDVFCHDISFGLGRVGSMNSQYATVLWLDENERVLAVTRASILLDQISAYTVTFSSDNEVVQYAAVSPGESVEKPADPEKAGWVFDGWFTSQSYETPWNFDDPVTQDITLYAKWSEDGGTPEEKTYTVTFDGNGGTPAKQTKTTGRDGKLIDWPDDPVRDGHSFNGWFTAQTAGSELNNVYIFTSDTTVYAQWSETGGTPAGNIYTITFDGNGGSPEKQIKTTDRDGKLTEWPSLPTRDGYSFDGWFTAQTAGSKLDNTYTFTSNTTIYAQWSETGSTPEVTHTVTFDSQGGSEVPAQTVASGGKVEKPADPTRSGYTFGGWFLEAACTNAWDFDTRTVAGDVTLYAKWTQEDSPAVPDTYTITFDANGGAPEKQTKTTGTDGKLSALPDGPTRDGFDFAGWYTAASGGEEVTVSTVFTKNATVYAHWSESSGTPSTPSTPTTPSGPYYQIFTPGYTYGGSFYVSHTSAAAGAAVTIRVSPWSNYELNWLTVTSFDTGRQVPLSRISTNEFIFTMPASNVTMNIVFTEGNTGGNYYGPGQSQAAAQPIKWYYSNGNIYHADTGLVSSGSQLTRDMLVTILYNMDGSSSGDPMTWAADNNVIPDIYESGLWGDDKPITREQAAMILFCYARYKGCSATQRWSLAGYADYGQIRTGARAALSWARAIGLLTDTSANMISPQGVLTCGEATDILLRFVVNVIGTW